MPNGKKHKNKITGDMMHIPSFGALEEASAEASHSSHNSVDITNQTDHMDHGDHLEPEIMATPVDLSSPEDIAKRLEMLWSENIDELDEEEQERKQEQRRIEKLVEVRHKRWQEKKKERKQRAAAMGSIAFAQKNVQTVDKVEKPVDNSEQIVEKEVSITVDQAVDKVFDAFFQLQKKALPAVHLTKKRTKKLYDDACGKLNKAVDRMAQTIHTSPFLRKASAIYTEQEAKASDLAAKAVNAVDHKLNGICDATICSTEKTRRTVALKLEQAKLYLGQNKRKVALWSGSGAALVVVALLIVSHFTAYEYMYNGKALGVVKDREDVYKIADVVEDKIGQTYHTKIEIDPDEDISFKRIFLAGKEADSQEDVLNSLTYMKDMKAKGYAIVIDGKQVAVLESKDGANEVLNSVKTQFIDQENKSQYKKVNFKEDVRIKSLDANLGDLQNHDDVLNYILTGQTEKKLHVVADGETMSEIAKAYGMKLSDLEASNPDIDPAKIFIGQEISLVKSVSMLNVHTEEMVIYAEDIPYEIQYEDVDTKYEGESTIKEEGLPGEKIITAKIVKENGIETAKEIIKEETTSEPVAQVVLRGTKEKPALVGTGTLIYPIRGKITSPYGSRWGYFHPALDIAAPSGTPIKASDGGQVVAAGYSGSYGNMVKIDHGGGKVTLYAHCSKLLVEKGESVSQGQVIANVGSTGNSTGPHVHFEVQVNGTTQNPLNYL